jgi:hypothetical protein
MLELKNNSTSFGVEIYKLKKQLEKLVGDSLTQQVNNSIDLIILKSNIFKSNFI